MQGDSGDNVAKQHRLLVCRMTLETRKRRITKAEPRIKLWKLKKEDCCEEFREEIRRALGGEEELPDDWTTTANIVRDTARKKMRERRENDEERVNLEVESISKEEVRENMQRMKNGKAVGPDDIPVEVWKCLGESALKFLTKLYNRTMESERMPEEWRDSVLIPIFKNKSDVQSCSNYRGIKLIGHTMNLWERIIERRLRRDLTFSNQQYGFVPGKSTTYRCIVCFESVDGEV